MLMLCAADGLPKQCVWLVGWGGLCTWLWGASPCLMHVARRRSWAACSERELGCSHGLGELSCINRRGDLKGNPQTV